MSAAIKPEWRRETPLTPEEQDRNRKLLKGGLAAAVLATAVTFGLHVKQIVDGIGANENSSAQVEKAEAPTDQAR